MCIRDSLGAHRGLGQIRDPQDQRTAGLKAVEHGGGSQMIGFTSFGARQSQRFDELPHMGRAPAGKKALLNALTVGQQSYAVAGVERQLGQRDCRRAGVVLSLIHI